MQSPMQHLFNYSMFMFTQWVQHANNEYKLLSILKHNLFNEMQIIICSVGLWEVDRSRGFLAHVIWTTVGEFESATLYPKRKILSFIRRKKQFYFLFSFICFAVFDKIITSFEMFYTYLWKDLWTTHRVT